MLNGNLGNFRCHGRLVYLRQVFLSVIPWRVQSELVKAGLIHWQVINFTWSLLSDSAHRLVLLLDLCLWAVALVNVWRIHVESSGCLREQESVWRFRIGAMLLLELLAYLYESLRFVHEFFFLVNHALFLQIQESLLLFNLGIFFSQGTQLLADLFLPPVDDLLLLSQSHHLGILVQGLEA